MIQNKKILLKEDLYYSEINKEYDEEWYTNEGNCISNDEVLEIAKRNNIYSEEGNYIFIPKGIYNIEISKDEEYEMCWTIEVCGLCLECTPGFDEEVEFEIL